MALAVRAYDSLAATQKFQIRILRAEIYSGFQLYCAHFVCSVLRKTYKFGLFLGISVGLEAARVSNSCSQITNSHFQLRQKVQEVALSVCLFVYPFVCLYPLVKFSSMVITTSEMWKVKDGQGWSSMVDDGQEWEKI